MTEARQPEDRKFFSSKSIRGKLFKSRDDAPAKESKTPEKPLNDDVVDFLKPSTTRAKAIAQQRQIQAPRIDISAAQRFPNASDLKTSSPAHAQYPQISERKLARRRLNLRVGFAKTAPEVIGEGGDEAELPASAVSKAFKGQFQPPLPHNGQRGGTNEGNASYPPSHNGQQQYGAPPASQNVSEMVDAWSPSESVKSKTFNCPPPPIPQDDDDFHPGFLKRTQTGLVGPNDGVSRPSIDSEDYRESMDSQREQPQAQTLARPTFPHIQTSFNGTYGSTPEHPRLPEMQSVIATSPRELQQELNSPGFLASDPNDPESLAAKVKRRMSADEGRALQEAFRNPLLLATDDDSRPSTRDNNEAALQALQGRPRVETRPSYATQQYQPQPSYPAHSSTQDSSPSIYSVPSNDLPAPSSPSASHNQNNSEYLQSPRAMGHMYNDSSATIKAPAPASRQQSYNDYAHTQPLQSPKADYSQPLQSPRRRPVAITQPSSPPAQHGSPSRSLRPAPSPGFAPPGFAPSPNLSIAGGLTPSPSYNPGFGPPSPSYFPPPQIAPPPGMDDFSRSPDMRYDHPISREPTRSMASHPPAKEDPAAALADFSERVVHMRGIFRLTAEMEKPMSTYTPMQFLRAAIWWFLKGRAGLELLIRNRPRGPDGRPPSRQQERLSQPHVDLAKTHWIVTDVMDGHAALSQYSHVPLNQRTASARSVNDHAAGDIFEAAEQITAHLRALAGSMKRNMVMPPESALIQGQDQSIWVQYPKFAPDVQSILCGQSSRSLTAVGALPEYNPLQVMPLGDGKQEFSYGRVFAQLSMATDDQETDRVQIPCVISIMRNRGEWQPKVVICSQSELVTVTISEDRRSGPTWDEVDWRARMNTIYIQMPRGFTLTLELAQRDFDLLWTVYERSRRVEESLAPAKDEKFIHELILKSVQYSDPAKPNNFPAERVVRCRIRVFEQTVKKYDFGGERKFHRNYRLLLVTSPKHKLLSSVSHEISMLSPLNVEFRVDNRDNGAPVMALRFKTENQQPASMFLTFYDPKERHSLFSVLNGSNLRPGEGHKARTPLKSFSVEVADQTNKFSVPQNDPLYQMQWQDVQVINSEVTEGSSPIDQSRTVMSESLRVVARNAAGAITDRLNLGPGKLLLRLSASNPTSLSLLRAPQEDLTLSYDPTRVSPSMPSSLDSLLSNLNTSSSIRTYTFSTLEDLHNFQFAITGHVVLFDGTATTFSISRRRMVVPIYKQWTASNVRLQIVQGNNITQLLAFFDGFSHADAMAIKLQAMDVFHKEKNNAVRLADAKFPLPDGEGGPEEGGSGGGKKGKGRKAEDRFVALEAGAYPGEHDDIVVGFADEGTREGFLERLPAQTQIRKYVSFKRKI